jgi:hypothetical protein
VSVSLGRWGWLERNIGPPEIESTMRRVLAVAIAALAVAGCSGEQDPAPAGLTTTPHMCVTRGRGLFSVPDPSCTPGALNPAVTQATITETICASGYTRTIRPPESVTEPEKLASMKAYGDSGSPHDFEYDHLIPLELGGAANDPRNPWPEPGATPNPKDRVENALHRLVCDGLMSLRAAQRIIAGDWVGYYRRNAR